MHLAFPHASTEQFQGCVRYLSLHPAQAPGPTYAPAVPRTPNERTVHTAVETLLPEWLEQGYAASVYQTADGAGSEGAVGVSLDFAYLLALIRCARPLVLETLTDAGDVWCTGAIEQSGERPLLAGLTRQDEFTVKLQAFCAQAHDHDRLFFVPAANVLPPQHTLCAAHEVQVLTLAAFRTALATALAHGSWPQPAVIRVGTRELPPLVAALFQPPSPWSVQRAARGAELRPPYKFLDAFGPADAEIFYGRDEDIALLQREFAGSRFLILYGASGTGKTSLVQAGLLPSLPAERYAWVSVRLVDAHPTEAIKAALVNDLGVDRQYLDRQSPLLEAVRAAVLTLGKAVVIVLDQGEEVFQRHARVVRQQFARDLGACLDALRLDVQVVMTVREDYFARLDEFRDAIPTVFHHTMRLTRLTPAQALAAVVEPAKQRSWSIDATLVEAVLLPQLVEAGQETVTPHPLLFLSRLPYSEPAIDPPLVQIVCDALYRHAAQAHRTTMGAEDYAALGDIRTILGCYLETTLQQFGTEQRQAREMLKTLVTAAHTKWAGFLDELVSRVHTAGVSGTVQALEGCLRRLVQARLVRATNVEGRTRYELSHEYLVGHIAAWLAEHERERTKVLEMLQRQYEVYRVTGLLLSQEGLAMVDQLPEPVVVPQDQEDYLTKSREVVRQQRRRLRLTVGTWLLAVALLVSGFWGWRLYQANQQLQATNVQLAEEKETAETQRQNAEQATRDAEAQTRRANLHLAQALVEQASRALLEHRFLHSYVLSAQALVLNPASARARALAYTSSVDMPYVFQGVVSHRAHSLQRIALSPDGRTLAAAAADGTIQLWAVPSRQPLLFLPPLEAPSRLAMSPDDSTLTFVAAGESDYRLAFSPDGRTLVAAGERVIRLWSVPSGQLQATFGDNQAHSIRVAFWPDGQTLATASLDRERGTATLRLWAVPLGWPLWNFTLTEASFARIALSPDGHVFVAADDRSLRVWEIPSGKPLMAVPTVPAQWEALPVDGIVRHVAISPDGHALVAADGRSLRVWAVPSGEPLRGLSILEGPLTSVAISPNRHTIATSGRLVRLLEMPTDDDPTWSIDFRGAPLGTTLLDHEQMVQDVTFSADGQILAYGTEDGTIRLWTANTQSRTTLQKGKSDAVFSPDGRIFATAGTTGVELWALPSGQHMATLAGSPSPRVISEMAFSPDGRTLTTVFPKTPYEVVVLNPDGTHLTTRAFTNDGEVWLWAIPSGQLLATFRLRDDASSEVKLSPDGRTLAVVATDGTIQLWDVPSDQLRTLLPSRTDGVNRIAFSPDGFLLAVAFAEGKKTAIALWKLPTDQLPGALLPQAFLSDEDGNAIDGIVDQLTFSPEGSLLVAGTARDGMLHLWAVPTFRYLTSFGVGEMRRLTFLPNGYTLAVGGMDGRLHLLPQLDLLHMTPEALYQQAQRATGMRVEGFRTQVIDAATQEAGEQRGEEPTQ